MFFFFINNKCLYCKDWPFNPVQFSFKIKYKLMFQPYDIFCIIWTLYLPNPLREFPCIYIDVRVMKDWEGGGWRIEIKYVRKNTYFLVHFLWVSPPPPSLEVWGAHIYKPLGFELICSRVQYDRATWMGFNGTELKKDLFQIIPQLK